MVLSILVVVSITELGPIIFLSLAQRFYGEYDAIFSSINDDVQDLEKFMTKDYLLNYTEINNILS